MTVREGDVERAQQIIEEYYHDRGFMRATVKIDRRVTDDNRVVMDFRVNRGPRVEVNRIYVDGNERFPDRRIRRRISNTKEDRWWRFWAASTYDETEFREDLENIVSYYNQRGYSYAPILSNSVDPSHGN